ncbi:hypothetical protein F1654_07065 [Alkalicaulis satelles]|uniref:DUF2946 domain-containing protein n=1 Tax=Alkalicaulis satelles TaxID=2609175 RepID=A0A5M6ZK00_9PROT|nr:hypothetical protein [Alkalicaulis satelles]KAA5803558.1 hypothetical protein F1654_07065 [Alkalicaulis satelles]
MRWFMSLLAILVLIEAGVRFCPGALGLEAHAHEAASTHAMPDCHGAPAVPDADPAGSDPACFGGVACGACVHFSVLDMAAAGAPGMNAVLPQPLAVHDAGPSALRLTDPPPPKR